MSTRIRIFCEEPRTEQSMLDDLDGKCLLNMLGRTYEGFLARGEGAQVVKALSKLSKDDNTGTITCAPKLVNFLLRNVTERLAHFAYKMNTTNDKVENQRYGKNGLKLTDDMLASSIGHDEVYRLSQLLGVLSLASRSYADVVFVREDLETTIYTGQAGTEEVEEEEEPTEKECGQAPDDEVEEETEEDESDGERESNRLNAELPTTQRRDIQESRKFGRVLVQRALNQPKEKCRRYIDLNDLMEEAEIEQWENRQDRVMLVHTVKEIVQMFVPPKEAVSFLVNLTLEQRDQIKSPFAHQMFKIEASQTVWPEPPFPYAATVEQADS